MGKKRRVMLAVLAVAVVTGIAWALLILRTPEPVCQGKRFTLWLDQYSTNLFYWMPYGSGSKTLRDQARDALQQIGTNGLPVLVKLAGARDSKLKRKFIEIARSIRRQPRTCVLPSKSTPWPSVDLSFWAPPRGLLCLHWSNC